MKKIFLLLPILFTISSQLEAIVCRENFYIQKYLNLYVCQDQTDFDYQRHYKWKARSVLLNQYIEKLIKEKKLESKKVNIRIFGPMSIPFDFEVSQNKKGYYIEGFMLNLMELLEIIEYFAHPKWKSYVPFYTAKQWQSIKRFFLKK